MGYLRTGMKDGKNVVILAIKSYLNANYVSHPEALFVSALVQPHPITAIGGITSRRLGLAHAHWEAYDCMGNKKELPAPGRLGKQG